MICPDCTLDYKTLTKKGICSNCYKSYYNALNRYKEGHSNHSYIPIKDLKYYNLSSFKKAMGRRLINYKKLYPDCTLTLDDFLSDKTTDENTKNDKTNIESTNIENIDKDKTIDKNTNGDKTIDENTTDENTKINYYSIVNKDISQAFKENNISIDYLNFNHLDNWISTLNSLIKSDSSGCIQSAKRAEQIFNEIFFNYNHCLEALTWGDDKIIKLGYMQKALCEIRRPTKEFLDLYSVIEPVISYIKNNKSLVNLIKTTYDNMQYKSSFHEEHIFHSSVETDISHSIDNVVKDDNFKLYDCTVLCKNYRGSSNLKLIRAYGGIKSINVVKAKKAFKYFLNKNFPTIIYDDKDITIEEVSSIDEIDERIKNTIDSNED